jgi:hypothetical protein
MRYRVIMQPPAVADIEAAYLYLQKRRARQIDG